LLDNIDMALKTVRDYHAAYKELQQQHFTQRVKLAMLTSYTSDFILPLVEVDLMASGIGAELYKPHFNQFRQEILDPNSELYRAAPDVTIVGFSLEDVFPIFDADRADLEAQILDLCESVIRSYRQFAPAKSRLFIQNWIAPLYSYDPLVRNDLTIASFVEALNRKLCALAQPAPNIHVIDYARLAQQCGLNQWADPRTYYTARIPVAQQNWIALSQYYAAYIRAALGMDLKCIVLDLDNTLWGGVLGEDGLEGIRLGESYPGLAFRRFQQYLLGLYDHGYILAISSKNNEEDVLQVLQNHPAMALRERHFAAIKANWRDKAENIQEISKEINISIDHILFVDDNPVEIEKVKLRLPGITCLQVESPPLNFARQFQELHSFAKLSFTEEDRIRGQQYFDDRQRREFKDVAGSIDEFYRSLSQKMTIYSNYSGHVSRIAQLTQRTNQFNMATIRLTEADVAQMIADPESLVLTADLSDRFGDSGTIAVVQIRKGDRTWTIENFLMSCRVLGRTVEETLLNYIFERAGADGIATVEGCYVETKKNAPFAQFYSSHGFARVSGGKYTKQVHDHKNAPSFIEISAAQEIGVHNVR
jgi:FkbH-like protein